MSTTCPNLFFAGGFVILYEDKVPLVARSADNAKYLVVDRAASERTREMRQKRPALNVRKHGICTKDRTGCAKLRVVSNRAFSTRARSRVQGRFLAVERGRPASKVDSMTGVYGELRPAQRSGLGNDNAAGEGTTRDQGVQGTFFGGGATGHCEGGNEEIGCMGALSRGELIESNAARLRDGLSEAEVRPYAR
ncbi:hypothetical protein N7539_002416 [Penicillium diatomitis]|uniref:Uncharacterized protein n=1 Tax=Penicillium diatomitis TaxID=2819901 RepID=A0A9W9XES1_9EURO|nr:uncharacterized protein N7539_002416 [Penicillium diatomitis]KAJ5490849.1 hypothetical protein N7539_002416 [Penicillium diatomitis]